MSDGIKVKIDTASIAKTSASMRSLKKYSVSGVWNMLNRITLFFLRSAITATPISRQKREIRRNVGRWRFAVGFPYGFTSRAERLGGDMDGNWLGTNSEAVAKDMALIHYWGAARASWNGMRRKMKVFVPERNKDLERVLSRSNWVKFIRAPEKQAIVTVNRLTYLDKIGGQRIRDTALSKALASFNYMEKKAVERGIVKAWNRRMAA